MEDKKYIVGISPKDKFHLRMHIEQQIGEIIYKQLISLLEIIGEERNDLGMPHLRLGYYLDTNNTGSRSFLLDEKAFDMIYDNYSHSFFKELNAFASRERKKGSEVLF
ncbi:protein of unknown function [Tenacibaculum sp. 190130A14a]|uniref:Phage protein n=1 Tax=Tenacibaculum polynesiense TaxID=3137857 RepID=A0ABP1F313_9FLAO